MADETEDTSKAGSDEAPVEQVAEQGAGAGDATTEEQKPEAD